MRYALIIPDGAADEPNPELGGRTPLEAADLPNLRALAREGRIGLTQNVADGFPPGSDIACMGLLGYHPARDGYTGRAAIEAAAQGLQIPDGAAVFRANFVTVADGRMVDHSAGHLSTAEGAELVAFLNENLKLDGIRLFPGVGYRHLCVIDDMAFQIPQTTPPHDIVGQEIISHVPVGGFSSWALEVERTSAELLADHPLNRRRVAEGKRPASQLWLWAGSTPMTLPPFAERFGRAGALITAVDLLRGIGRLSGLEVIEVEGATGFPDTNFAGKGRAAVEALGRLPFVAVHVEAPDEAGHAGDVKGKVKSLEEIDRHVVGPLLAEARRSGDLRLCVSSDHPTPVARRTHTRSAVPYILWGPGIPASGAAGYSEALALAADDGAEPIHDGALIRDLFAE